MIYFTVTASGARTRFVQIRSNVNLEPLQISQIVVLDARGVNLARGKTCNASSTYTAKSICQNALDGWAMNREPPDDIFHSGTNALNWFMVDLGAPFAVAQVVFYNRAGGNAWRAGGTLLQLLDSSNQLLAQRSLNQDQVQSFSFPTTGALSVMYQCENQFEGGGWVLVRRVKAGSKWHPATDDLRGTDAYGIYGTTTSDSTFSIAYSSWVTLSTPFLFMTGMRQD